MNKQTQKELLNIVKQNYEEIAGEFSKTRNKQIWPELEKIAEIVNDNDKVLDVGCGNGRLLEVFKNKKINYLGIDNSAALIELAKEKYQGNFLQGDILELSLVPDINFDYVFCIAVLQHIPGKRMQIDALKQLRNKINENGKVVISVWNLWPQKKFRNLIIKFFLLKMIKKNKMDFGDILFDWKNSSGQVISKRYYHAFYKIQLKRIFKKAGFKIEKIYKDQFNYYAILKK